MNSEIISLFESETLKPETHNQKPVTCLGIVFPNDEERRKHFTELLRIQLLDPDFRKIEGFPIGKDEDILALSDPPYYTACPNPWIGDFVKEWEAAKPAKPEDYVYQREPYAADVSEGKNDPIYNAHSYHTKVPHKAIMRYILHYTQPGDIVFDGFCGTGMTGVAAQMCGDRNEVLSLGYQIKSEGIILQKETDAMGKECWVPFSNLGARHAVLNDLSPAATFIAYNYNTPVDVVEFEKEAKRILHEVEKECGWMYETLHVEPASSRLIEEIGFQPCDPFKSPVSIYHKDNLPHIQVPGATYFITYRTENFRVLSAAARQCALDAILFWDKKRWKVCTAVVMPDHVHVIARLLQKEYSQQDAGSTNEYSRHPGGCNNSERQHPAGFPEFWLLEEILHSVKSFSANEINKIENMAGATVWQSESYDRVVRDQIELTNELAYVSNNPVKAGLVKNAEEYTFRFVAEELKRAGWKPAARGKINYTVWSDVFICPECTKEVVFWEAAIDKEAGQVNDEFPCPRCSANLSKRNMERSWMTKYDSKLKLSVKQAKQVPVLINYTLGSKRIEKKPDVDDLRLVEKIEAMEIPYWFPINCIPEGDKTNEPIRIGYTHVNHLFTKRNLWVLAAVWSRVIIKRKRLPFLVTASQRVLSKMASIAFSYYFHGGGGYVNAGTKGTLYISSTNPEVSVFNSLESRIRSMIFEIKSCENSVLIENKSTTACTFANDCSFDYIFIDPPFGANINYSELNILWEPWLKVLTANKYEAIESKQQDKGSIEYRQLMKNCFIEAYRLLKPGRWLTVEFSNTKASVWNNIQTAITEAGFLVANVSALDKKQGSFNAYTNTTSVKQDLVISAYKPNGGFEERFETEVTSEEGVWDFVRTHLKYLPVIKKQGIQIQRITERDPRILFDQMIAYYVRKGYTVPIDSHEFQAGLAHRFSERDEMYFLPEQAAEYDRKKMNSGVDVGFQQDLFVDDESSAIEWLRNLLKTKPQSFQDINPEFMQKISGWKKTEKGLELSTLLRENFLCYEGKELVPEQIHAYLSTNWKDMRNLPKDDPTLVEKAADRWYLPDPNKAGDIEKLREKALLREFDDYKDAKKKLKVFRLEAVRAGFKKAWQERDYATIISVAEKIPSAVLEEDPKLLMWFDQAVTRKGDV